VTVLGNAFKKFDVNGDGVMNCGEFTKLMNSLGGFQPDEIKKLFKEADSDKSGGVDWKEFVRWICSSKSEGGSKLGDRKGIMQSFSRMLRHEAQSEAAFVKEATLNKQVESFLKASNQDKAEIDEINSYRKKQLKVKQQMSQNANAAATSYPSQFQDWGEMAGIPASYDGYRLPVPFTFEGAKGLMTHYLRHGESKPLHPKYVAHLTTQFTAVYKNKHPKPVVHINTPNPGRLVLVGDTHGQLADVLHIFHQLDLPTAQNRYLFNGDVADRGHQATEIFMMLFAFFLADPDCLIINRGNHENEDMNGLDFDAGGGFQEEVVNKYGLQAYRRFSSVFQVLSLCCVVEKEIFVVHGGLSRSKMLTLEYINSIDHHECSAPYPLSTQVKDQIFSDLLWSDPCEQAGKFKSERGVGIKFGPDITTKFCMINKLRFVVRSHQLPDDGRGFSKQHEGRCVTIFSASNYCGSGGNYGAVMVLASEYFPRYEIYEHFAAKLEDLPHLLGLTTEIRDKDQAELEAKKEQEAKSTEAMNVRWERELEKMIVGVIEKKPDLWSHLIVDAHQGVIRSLDDFEDTMSTVIDPNLPWIQAARYWGVVENETIDMVKFLNRWRVDIALQGYSIFVDKAVSSVYESMLCLDMDMERTFRYFDKDRDGTVDIKELRQVLGMFDLGLTPCQIDRLTGQIFARVIEGAGPTHAEGECVRICVSDFLNNLMVVYKKTKNMSLPEWVVDSLDKLGRLIIKSPQEALLTDVEQAATKIQKVFRGQTARKDIPARKNVAGGDVDTARPTCPDVSPINSWKRPTLRKLSANVKSSFSSNKSICAPAGAEIPKVRAAMGCTAGFGEDLSEHVPTIDLSRGGWKMAALFDSMDSSGDGFLDLEEFARGIAQIPGFDHVLFKTGANPRGEKLTHDKCVELAKYLDVSGNGSINYLEFLQALTPVAAGAMDILDSLCEDITTVLFRHRVVIRRGCHFVDEPGMGKVSREDFHAVLMGVNSALSAPERNLTNMQITLLVDALAVEGSEDEDPYIDYDSFLRSFVIFDCQKKGAEPDEKGAVVKKYKGGDCSQGATTASSKQPADVCTCGKLFSPEAKFCNQCGARRS